MVMKTLGNGSVPRGAASPQLLKTNSSLVSKLNSAVCVKTAEEPAGIVKLPHRELDTAPPPNVTVTPSIRRDAPERLSILTAPASNVGPDPMNKVFGDPAHGVG